MHARTLRGYNGALTIRDDGLVIRRGLRGTLIRKRRQRQVLNPVRSSRRCALCALRMAGWLRADRRARNRKRSQQLSLVNPSSADGDLPDPGWTVAARCRGNRRPSRSDAGDDLSRPVLVEAVGRDPPATRLVQRASPRRFRRRPRCPRRNLRESRRDRGVRGTRLCAPARSTPAVAPAASSVESGRKTGSRRNK